VAPTSASVNALGTLPGRAGVATTPPVSPGSNDQCDSSRGEPEVRRSARTCCDEPALQWLLAASAGPRTSPIENGGD
jgi:hypothetical protein